MNVLRHRTNDFPTYCGEITSQYTSGIADDVYRFYCAYRIRWL